jgi:hypothetical protein
MSKVFRGMMRFGHDNANEAPRPQGGASRKGSFVHIVPLDPAYKAGLAGHVPVKEYERNW